MDISEFTPEQLEFWNRMRESHQTAEFAQLQAQLRQDKSLLDFCNSALIQAAREGDREAVELLLDVGATLNRERDGRMYCDALNSSASAGKMEVVKLLVERGADLKSINEYDRNAMMSAESSGHDEVAAFLKSQGMIDLDAIRVYDVESAHETILETIQEFRGPVSAWHDDVPGDPRVVIRHIPSGSCEWNGSQVLFTIGLSDHRLPMGRIKSFYTELQIHLSPEWPLTPEALSQAKWNWPIEWMKRIASQLRCAEGIVESPLFLNGSPPQPLAPNTKLCGWAGRVYEGAAGTYDVEGGKTVYTLVLIPIYNDEISIVAEHGVDELEYQLDLLIERGEAPTWIDPSRPSIAG